MTVPTPLSDLLGPLATLLDAPDVIEISCNPDGAVFISRFGRAKQRWGDLSRDDTDRFVRWCATLTETGITPENPILSGRIPGTPHRIEALVPPVVDGPMFSIRRHAERIIPLAEFIPEPEPRGILTEAIATRKTILIAGATGAGKTTLLNSCLDHLAGLHPDLRVITIEDTPEIRSPFDDRAALRSCDGTDMDRLLVSTLRLAPGRIVVGEVREGRVLMTLIKALNTGHPGGLTTLHANSAAEVLPRLRILAQEVMEADPTPVLMACLDLVVFLRRGAGRPEIATIAAATETGTGSGKLEIRYENT